MGNLDFDIESVEARSMDYEPLPPGKYTAEVISSEVVPTSKGDGKILKLTFSVLDKEFSGRKVFENLNIENPSEMAQQIARGMLSALCRACGKTGVVSNSEELHEVPMTIKVKIEPGQGAYGPKNRITEYSKVEVAAKINGTVKKKSAAPVEQRPLGEEDDDTPDFLK